MRRRHLALGAGIGATVLAAAGAAAAYWLSTGSGSGGAVTDPAPLGVTIVATRVAPSTTLTPGGTADLVLQLNNPNPYAVTLTGIAQNGDVNASGSSGCTASNNGVRVPVQTGLALTVPSGSDVLHLSAAATMSTTSASSCQGASFQIPLAVTVRR